jgi:hypothetical protein
MYWAWPGLQLASTPRRSSRGSIGQQAISRGFSLKNSSFATIADEHFMLIGSQSKAFDNPLYLKNQVTEYTATNAGHIMQSRANHVARGRVSIVTMDGSNPS